MFDGPDDDFNTFYDDYDSFDPEMDLINNDVFELEEFLDFGTGFDEMDAAFVLGFADEMGEENREEEDDSNLYEPEYLPLRNPYQRTAGVLFENMVKQYIDDLHVGKKQLGDKL